MFKYTVKLLLLTKQKKGLNLIGKPKQALINIDIAPVRVILVIFNYPIVCGFFVFCS